MAKKAESTHKAASPGVSYTVTAIRWLLAALILSNVLINFANVVARYLFLSPIFWAEDVISYSLVWCVFLGAALVTWDDRHISVDIASSAFPPWLKITSKVLGALCLLVIAVLVVPRSWETATMMAQNDQRTAVSEMPLVIPHSAVLVGFLLISIAALARVVDLLRHPAQVLKESEQISPSSDMTE